MRHRALVGIISILGVAALFGLFAALASPFSPPDSAYAQSNTPPSFPSGEIYSRRGREHSLPTGISATR